jgi:hypothetical protein
VPPLISLSGDLIVDRIEARGTDSDQGFVNPWERYRNFTDTQTGGRARFIEKNSFHEIRPYIPPSQISMSLGSLGTMTALMMVYLANAERSYLPANAVSDFANADEVFQKACETMTGGVANSVRPAAPGLLS